MTGGEGILGLKGAGHRVTIVLLGAGLAGVLLGGCGASHSGSATNAAGRPAATDSAGGPSASSSASGSGAPATHAAAKAKGKKAGAAGTSGHKSTRQSTRQSTQKHQGSTRISASGKHQNQTVVLTRLPGSAKQGCEQVGNRHDVRSGSMAAGPFDSARRSYGRGPVRLYWIPQQTGDLSGVTVTATNLSTGTVVHYRHTIVSYAEPWQYYDTLIELHPAGTWKLQATSGNATGCFLVKLG